jgi:GxxExxY protein
MTENEIAKTVVNICFNIHKQYGPGLFESVYEEILCYELTKAGLEFTRQEKIGLVHDGVELELAFKADIIVEESVIIELKSVAELEKVHYKQLLTYLKLTHLKLGLLINFNVELIRDGIHRVINGYL